MATEVRACFFVFFCVWMFNILKLVLHEKKGKKRAVAFPSTEEAEDVQQAECTAPHPVGFGLSPF